MIKITLSAANMGDVDEMDVDCWNGFVSDEIDAAVGFEVAVVDQFPWGRPMPGEDAIEGATEEQVEAIRQFLSVDGWARFCGEEWETRRAAKEAALGEKGW